MRDAGMLSSDSTARVLARPKHAVNCTGEPSSGLGASRQRATLFRVMEMIEFLPTPAGVKDPCSAVSSPLCTKLQTCDWTRALIIGSWEARGRLCMHARRSVTWKCPSAFGTAERDQTLTQARKAASKQDSDCTSSRGANRNICYKGRVQQCGFLWGAIRRAYPGAQLRVGRAVGRSAR